MSSRKRRLHNNKNNSSENPSKKQRLESCDKSSQFCKFGCGRNIPNGTKWKYCCRLCTESNRGKIFDLNQRYTRLHTYKCNNREIAKYDKQHNSEYNSTSLWSLFGPKRKYRKSGNYIRWHLDVKKLYDLIISDEIQRKYMNIFAELNGMLISDFYSMYIKYKKQLKNEKNGELIDEFDNFFECYQYADGIDIEGNRNAGLLCIGLSNYNDIINNIKTDYNLNELRFIGNWGDYGYGFALEFCDAPMEYFDDSRCEYRVIDCLMLDDLLNENEQEKNDEKYFYFSLIKQIEEKKKNPKKLEYPYWTDGTINLDKFPNEYIVVWVGSDGQWEWLLRTEFEADGIKKERMMSVEDIDDNNQAEEYNRNSFRYLKYNMMVPQWINIYNYCIKQRKERVMKYCCSVSTINVGLIRLIVDFAI